MVTQKAFRALEGIYAELEEELQRYAPLCRMSGVCCRFARAGHRLYTTMLEYEYLRYHTTLAPLIHDHEDGIDKSLYAPLRHELTGLEEADRGQLNEGSCPFLKEGKCGVRDHRMLGCRIYFCDPAFQPHMGGIYEKYHARIRNVMRQEGIPYAYFNYLDVVRSEMGGVV